MPETEYHDDLKLHKRSPRAVKTAKTHPFNTPCDREFTPASKNSGTRSPDELLLMVAHGTQGKTGPGGARQTAGYFHSPASLGSAQYCIDGDECYKVADDNVISWGVTDVNTWTLHFEMASLAAWSRIMWFLPFNRRMLNRTAWKMARKMRQHGIPCEFWNVPRLNAHGQDHFNRRVKMGWTYHRCLSDSTVSSSTHQDPWPKRTAVGWYFANRVKFYFDNPGVNV